MSIETTTSRHTDRTDDTIEPSPHTRARRRRHSVLAAATAALAAVALAGGATVASAEMSKYVNVQYRNFAAPAADCTAYAGAHMRADKMAQGEAQVPCNLRHAQTVTSVRLVRWNGSSWVPQPWTTYTYTNSFGTGGADLVTSPSRICGNAAWYTEVYSTVKTGTTYNNVWFTNNYQWYDPCV